VTQDVDLAAVYDRRFAGEAAFRHAMWKVLCERFFQRYVDRNAVVMEIGAGHCEFINNIAARRKIAVDLSTDTPNYANADVEVVSTSSTDLGAVADASIDVAFASNFFEHLTRDQIVATMRELRRTLSPRGRLLILQPNIRYCYRDYWMFFDHITPLDDRSLVEVLQMTGFVPLRVVRRFLPFTTKGRLPNSLALLKIYLAVPPLWRLFGAQSFVVAKVAEP
jgi:SAM-dependent methyltransferase